MKAFNVSGACRPDRHYMVDLKERLGEVRKMVDAGQYFAITRARQYGKKGDSSGRGAWTKSGFQEALKMLLSEKNALYESLVNKLEDYPELKTVLYDLLFTGRPIPYTAMNKSIEVATMFGFVKNADGTAVVSNRIFESVLYCLFLSEDRLGQPRDRAVCTASEIPWDGGVGQRMGLEADDGLLELWGI